MKTKYQFLKAWFQARLAHARGDGERGANLVEYVLLLALIALVVIAAVVFVGNILRERFEEAGSELDE